MALSTGLVSFIKCATNGNDSVGTFNFSSFGSPSFDGTWCGPLGGNNGLTITSGPVQGTGDFTQSIIIKTPTTLTLSSNNDLWSHSGDQDTCLIDTSGKLSWYHNNGSAGAYRITGTTTVTAGQAIHQATFTRSGQTATLYLDGVSQGTYTLSANFNFNQAQEKLGLHNNGTGENFVSGFVRYYTTWSRALSPSEVAALWNNGNPVDPTQSATGLNIPLIPSTPSIPNIA